MNTHKKKVVIYTRVSCDVQPPEGCADQEQLVRDTLTKAGIDHSEVLVLRDKFERGAKTSS